MKIAPVPSSPNLVYWLVKLSKQYFKLYPLLSSPEIENSSFNYNHIVLLGKLKRPTDNFGRDITLLISIAILQIKCYILSSPDLSAIDLHSHFITYYVWLVVKLRVKRSYQSCVSEFLMKVPRRPVIVGFGITFADQTDLNNWWICFISAVIGGAVVGLLCAILVVMFIVYRMRKKDEGSYALDEPRRSPAAQAYPKPGAPHHNREFYAWSTGYSVTDSYPIQPQDKYWLRLAVILVGISNDLEFLSKI